jgi:hypothetical protein
MYEVADLRRSGLHEARAMRAGTGSLGAFLAGVIHRPQLDQCLAALDMCAAASYETAQRREQARAAAKEIWAVAFGDGSAAARPLLFCRGHNRQNHRPLGR